MGQAKILAEILRRNNNNIGHFKRHKEGDTGGRHGSVVSSVPTIQQPWV